MFFTADLHYGHDNIVKHCRRPVMSPQEVHLMKTSFRPDGDGADFKISPETRQRHHDLLVNGVNERVGKDDTLWILGDCCDRRWVEEFRDRVVCRDLRLIRGNHDTPHIEWAFTQVHDILPVCLSGKWMVLCHYPMKSWYKSHRGAYQLHGHCHGRMTHQFHELQADVGVDVWGYKPVSLDEILEYMARREPSWVTSRANRMAADPAD